MRSERKGADDRHHGQREAQPEPRGLRSDHDQAEHVDEQTFRKLEPVHRFQYAHSADTCTPAAMLCEPHRIAVRNIGEAGGLEHRCKSTP